MGRLADVSYTTLNDTRELEAACDIAREDGRVGIDTEFLWERTYAPILCLVQLRIDDQTLLADPFDGIDLAPVAALVSDPAVEVVMHAPHADLVGFALRNDATPTNVFDTQISAGFVGLSGGLAYERLVQETIGVQLAGGEGFTDWSRRPLTERQLRYAAEDVDHLFDVADWIRARLDELGRTAWAEEELLRRFGTPSRLTTQPAEAWRKVGRRGKLNGTDLAVLQAVAAWRENNARTRDIPTAWVLKDATLIELARRAPGTSSDLYKVRGIDGSLRKNDVEGLLHAIVEGTASEPISEGPPPARMVRKRVAIAKGLAAALLRARAEAVDIAPELVGTSGDVEELIAFAAAGEQIDGRDESELPALLRGWRAEFGTDLVDLLDGRVQLQLVPEEPWLRIHEAADN